MSGVLRAAAQDAEAALLSTQAQLAEAQEERRRAAEELQSVQARAAVQASELQRQLEAQKHEADTRVTQLEESLREMMRREAEAAGAGDAGEEERELQRRLGREVARLSAELAAMAQSEARERSDAAFAAARADELQQQLSEARRHLAGAGSRCRQRPPGRQHCSHTV